MDITGRYVEVALSDSAASECLGMEGTASGVIIAGSALGESGEGVWPAIESDSQMYSNEQNWPAPETYLIPRRYISAIRCLPDGSTERNKPRWRSSTCTGEPMVDGEAPAAFCACSLVSSTSVESPAPLGRPHESLHQLLAGWPDAGTISGVRTSWPALVVAAYPSHDVAKPLMSGTLTSWERPQRQQPPSGPVRARDHRDHCATPSSPPSTV